MGNTLIELEYLSTDALRKGIIDTIINESPLLARMPFQTISGNAYKYNLETALAGASWYSVGDTWVPSEPTWGQRTAELTILGGDADVDQFIQKTRTDQNIEGAVIEMKAKAIANEFEKQAILGATTTAAQDNSMKGLLRLLAECESDSTVDLDAPNNAQVMVANAASGALTLDLLDELIDKIKPGKPDILLMSRRMRRKLNALARATGTTLRVQQDAWGKFISIYDEIPVLINDHIPNNIQDGTTSVLTIASYDPTTTRASGYDNSIIFALKFGEDGVCGLQNGGLETEYLGTLESKNAKRTRIKWYCGMACYSTLKIAGMINVLDTAL